MERIRADDDRNSRRKRMFISHMNVPEEYRTDKTMKSVVIDHAFFAYRHYGHG
jgi:hypothetical protein